MFIIVEDTVPDPKQLVLKWDYGVVGSDPLIIYKLESTQENLDKMKAIKKDLSSRG